MIHATVIKNGLPIATGTFNDQTELQTWTINMAEIHHPIMVVASDSKTADEKVQINTANDELHLAIR